MPPDDVGAESPGIAGVFHDGLRRADALPTAGRSPRARVVILPGRCEFIEKYAETVADLTARGFAVRVIEWRGHGLSDGRRSDNRQKHHLDDFDILADDLDAITADGGTADREPDGLPQILLAHSMGGLVAALHLARRPDRYAAAVLCAPMFDIITDPWPKTLARAATRAACAAGFAEHYAFGQRDYDPAEAVFTADNPLSGDPRRFAVLHDAWAAAPEMRLGGVTFGWLDAAFRAMDAAVAGKYALERVKTPVLILSAPDDRIVDAASHAVVAARFGDARKVDFPGARHELLMERDAVRDAVLRAVDDFLADVLPPERTPP